jgi:hypothetical protein
MKNIWILISLIILGLTACSTSEQVADLALVPFFPPTTTPVTNDPTLDYFRQYVSYMQEWGTEFDHIRDLSLRLSDEGLYLLDDETFISELSNALADFQTAAKNAAELEPPTTELQKFQDKAEELHEQSEIFANSYMLALAGDATALESFRTALNKVSGIFLEIRDEIENGNYIP